MRLYFKKLYKNKGSWLPIGVFVLAVLLVLVMNTRVGAERNLEGMEREDLATNKEALVLNQQSLESAQTQEEKEAFAEGIKISEAHIEKQQKIIDSYSSGNWSEAYKIKIGFIKEASELYNEDMPDYSYIKESNLREVAIYTQLMKLDIKSDQEDLETQGATFLYRMLASFFPVFFIVVLCFTLNISFTDRFYNHLDRSLLLPQKYVKGTSQRLLFGFLVAVTLYVMSCLLAYLSASMLSGAGSFEYPIAVERKAEFVTMPVGGLLVKAMTLQILAIIVVVLTVDLVSKLCKRVMSTLFVSLLILVVPVVAVGKIVPLNIWAEFLPGTYFNAVSVVDNSLAILCDNAGIHFSNGVLVLVVTTIVLLILNFGIDSRRSKVVNLNADMKTT
ncbi:hypothetical protein [Paenilisteria rocourtiae]|uniref:ABC-2 type transport system permease protein n=1 Tax=Listeria rocourtiae TaxID=647910 RepID=A0A4R6ZFS3_9LIST|nr:hypothetical protein [Listeria rocourtiae]EUJ48931.1 hypothetical protein PROCOU_05123 [Listeria rocourtiae FSL F6-920]MBC1436190.1 hypothetical protein [Listeria rocourtiae]MBC1605853.1 hypothetical protein [Listeria rocourtiae]TDR50689.1 hypothetical protein DFP96_11812 [Listeria rocourtiae]